MPSAFFRRSSQRCHALPSKPGSLRGSPKKASKSIIWLLLGVALLLAAWSVLAALYSPVLLPSPLEVGRTVVRLAVSGELWRELRVTLLRLAVAFGLGALLGTLLGLATGRNPNLVLLLRPGMSVATGLPPVAWIALALIWFGTGSLTPIFVALLVAMPVAFTATVEGMRALDADLLAMARVFALRGPDLWRELYLPALAPYLLTGLSTAAALTVRVGIMGEFLASSTGVGSAMSLARTQLNTAEVLAWVLVSLALLGLSEGLIMHPLARRAARWRAAGEA
jgi:NitT/TauT family transport system permease protein